MNTIRAIVVLVLICPAISLAAEPSPSNASRHWAFAPVKKNTPPADATGWSRNAIDQFVLTG